MSLLNECFIQIENRKKSRKKCLKRSAASRKTTNTSDQPINSLCTWLWFYNKRDKFIQFVCKSFLCFFYFFFSQICKEFPPSLINHLFAGKIEKIILKHLIFPFLCSSLSCSCSCSYLIFNFCCHNLYDIVIQC